MPATEPASGGGVAITITGMTCEGCARAVTRALSRVPGVAHAAVDLARGRARVEGTASADALLAAVSRAGYDAALG